MKKFFSLLLIFFITFSSFNFLYAESQSGVVNDKLKKRLKVRKKPNKKSEVKAYLYKGNAVTVRKKKGKWNKVVSGDTKGWVLAKYITIVEEANPINNPSSDQSEHNLIHTANEAKVKKANELNLPSNDTLLSIQIGTPLN